MATARTLEQAAAGPPSRGAANPTPSVSLRPGTRLVREWRGVTHTALIHADEIEWRGQRFTLAEVGRGWAKTNGAITLNLVDSHAHFAELNITGNGVIR
jgi:hypothetical protein